MELDGQWTPPGLVSVELARSAGVELDKHLVAPVVDVGGSMESIMADLVGHGELGVGDGGLDPLLLGPGFEGWTRGESRGQDSPAGTRQRLPTCCQGFFLAVPCLQFQIGLGEVSLCHRHLD